MKKILLFTLITSLFLVSCINEKDTKNKDLLRKDISRLEKKIFSDKNYSPVESDIDSMILLYNNYIEEYYNDTLKVLYMFKEAGLLRVNRKFEHAVALFEDINSNYPDFEKAPDALLYEAMIYGDDLKNEVMAEKKYKEFISKYPNNPYRKDAEELIKLLGKSDKEIMEILLKNDSIK